IGGNAALVRFATIRSDAGAQAQPPSSWVAVIRYRYSDAPMSLEDRFVNPLGFQVTSYRKDQEVLTPGVAPQPVSAAAGAPGPAAASAAPAPYYGGGQQPIQAAPSR